MSSQTDYLTAERSKNAAPLCLAIGKACLTIAVALTLPIGLASRASAQSSVPGVLAIEEVLPGDKQILGQSSISPQRPFARDQQSLGLPVEAVPPIPDEHASTDCENLEAPIQLPEPPRAPAPLVILTSAASESETWSLSSSDVRAGWIPVEYQRLKIVCETPEASSPKAIAFYLDGHPYGGVRSLARSVLDLPSPPTGRHLLQARYLDSNFGWSRISAPIRFEVIVPPTPTILSVHDSKEPSGPVNPHSPAEITSGMVTLKLAHVWPQTHIDIYVDGRHATSQKTSTAGCVHLELWRHCEAGKHAIRVRQSAGTHPCSIASPLSDPVTVHYFHEPAFVRKTPLELVKLPDSPTDSPRANGGDEPTVAAKCPVADSSEACNKYDYRHSHVFMAPAHFPIQQFSMRGEPDDRDGIFIYEGMKLSIWNNGAYKVEFRTSIPRVPASIRMQLLVRLNSGTWHTITLQHAYVRGASEVGKSSPVYTEGQVITKQGVLAGFTPQEIETGIAEVRREGTAHFGYERAQTTTIWKQ